MSGVSKALVANWFYPVALLLFLTAGVAIAALRVVPTRGPGPDLETALLADIFLTLPALYWLCFRKRHGTAKLLLGATAVVCSGLWLAGLILPTTEQRILPQLSWLRYAGLAIIVGFEIRLAALAFRLMWRPQAKAADLEAQGVPPVVAKLMLLEARFWRWVASGFRK